MEVTGKLKDRNWLRIAYEGQVAYVFAPLLKEIDLEELADWRKAKDNHQAKAYEDFLKNHPDGHFAGRAKTGVNKATINRELATSMAVCAVQVAMLPPAMCASSAVGVRG